MSLLKSISLGTILFLITANPLNAFELISAEDINDKSNGNVATIDLSRNAETEFLAKLTSDVGTESFENFAWATSGNLDLDFPSAGTATLSGNGEVYSIEHTEGVTDQKRINHELSTGRYASSGINYWHVLAGVGDSSTFTINFSQDIAALGFYTYDLGDFGGELSIEMYRDGELINTISNTSDNLYTSTDSGAVSGSAVYIGIVGEKQNDDSYETFDQVKFVIANVTGTMHDEFAFDDMTIATSQQIKVQQENNLFPD